MAVLTPAQLSAFTDRISAFAGQIADNLGLDAEEREFLRLKKQPCREFKIFIEQLNTGGVDNRILAASLQHRMMVLLRPGGDEMALKPSGKVSAISEEISNEVLRTALGRLQTLDASGTTQSLMAAAELRNQLQLIMVPPHYPLLGRYTNIVDVSNEDIKNDLLTHFGASFDLKCNPLSISVKREDTSFRNNETPRPARKITIYGISVASAMDEISRGLDRTAQKELLATTQVDLAAARIALNKLPPDSQQTPEQKLDYAKLQTKIATHVANEQTQTELLNRIEAAPDITAIEQILVSDQPMTDSQCNAIAALVVHAQTVKFWISHDCNYIKVETADNAWYLWGSGRILGFFNWLIRFGSKRVVKTPIAPKLVSSSTAG